MNSRSMRKTSITILCLFLLTFFTGIASAQDVSKTKTKSSVDAKAREEAQKRREELSKRLKQDKNKKSDIEKGPSGTLEQAKDKQNKLSPEEIDRLRLELEQKNSAMITKLDQIIQGDPYSEQKPEWMFQKAELTWELRNWQYLRDRAEFNKCLEAVDKGNVAEDKCAEPKADYETAQAIYLQILQQYPSYERLDEVIYRLGRGLIESGKGAQAVSYLQRLVQNYPNSKYLPEAYLALGEFYFDKNVFGLAKANYEAVLKFADYSFYDYALYKLGWTFFNQQEFRASIDTFKKVVEQKDDTLGFQNQAINDLLVAFAAVDDGWLEARAYFMEKRGKEFTYTKMNSMAGFLEAAGKDEDSVKIYEWLIKEQPDDSKIPQWMESVIVLLKKDVNNMAGLETAMNRYVAYLDPQGSWVQKNKENKGSLSNAELLTEASLAFLASHYHTVAQKKDESKQDAKTEYEKAAGYYERFIKRFPNKPASFDMNFFLGEIYLLSLNRLEDAAKQYQKVVDLYKSDQVPEGVDKKQAELFVKDSAYAIIQSYNELVKQNVPDSILVKMAEAAEKSKDGVFKTKDKQDLEKANPKVELHKYESGFVAASDQWGEMYPKDESTPTIDYVSAEVYKARGHYDRCIPRYENIIVNASKHRYASYAGASLLDANYQLRRWDDVEKWARYLLKNKIFDVTPETGLKETIAFAINERSKELKDAGNTDQAASELVRLADEFPKSDLAPGALFNAAAIYEVGNNIKKATETYERVVKEHPDSEKASEALFVMGAIFEARADYDRAAGYFERLATEKYRTRPQAADAIYNAGVLRESLQQWDKAIDIYEKYMGLFPERPNIKEVQFKLALIDKDRGEHKKALSRLQDWIDGKDIKGKKVKDRKIEQTELVHSYTEMGLMHEQIKGKKWEQDSEALFKKSIELWNKMSEEDKTKSKEYASQAKFRLAERIFGKFKGVTLNFPMGALVKSLQEKGKYEQEAEALYTEIIQMKSPYYVAAAAYRVGLMYKEFSDQLYNLPMPEGLTPDQEDEYRGQLDEYAFPLQEKALKAYQAALKLALEYKAYNEWSAKSAKEISKLESEAYPITEQDGVNPLHRELRFSRTQPETDNEKVKTRLKAAKSEADRIKAEQEAAEKARQEELKKQQQGKQLNAPKQ